MIVILSEAKDLTRLQSAFYGDQFRINAPNLVECSLEILSTARSLAPLGMTEYEPKDLTNYNEDVLVYMMTNQSRVVLYTGITNSLVRRVWQHQNGEIEGFTKSYTVKRLVYYECFNAPRDAIAREKEIKGWRREKKNALVETKNPKWADLSPVLFQHFKPSSGASATACRRQ
jgi:putative endonuclease